MHVYLQFLKSLVKSHDLFVLLSEGTTLINSLLFLLHAIGVNDFSTPPAVPSASPEYFGSSHAFWWQDTESDARVLAYYASSYSQGSSVPEMAVVVSGFDEALVFFFHVDNTGPHDTSQVYIKVGTYAVHGHN